MGGARPPMSPQHDADAKRTKGVRDSRAPNVQLETSLIELHQRQRTRNGKKDQKQNAESEHERVIHLAEPRLCLEPTLPTNHRLHMRLDRFANVSARASNVVLLGNK